MSRKKIVDHRLSVEYPEQWENELDFQGLTVVEVFSSFFGDCEVLVPTIDKLMIQMDNSPDRVKWLKVNIVSLESQNKEIRLEEEQKRREMLAFNGHGSVASSSNHVQFDVPASTNDDEDEAQEAGEPSPEAAVPEGAVFPDDMVSKLEKYSGWSHPQPLYLLMIDGEIVDSCLGANAPRLEHLVRHYAPPDPEKIPKDKWAAYIEKLKRLKPVHDDLAVDVFASNEPAPEEEEEAEEVVEEPTEPEQPATQFPVRIQLLHGEQIAQEDITSESDPFVEVHFQGDKYTSQTVQDRANPVWNETIEFIVESVGESTLLTFRVMDEDKGSKDDFVGIASVDVMELEETGQEGEPLWLDLVKARSADQDRLTPMHAPENRGRIAIRVSFPEGKIDRPAPTDEQIAAERKIRLVEMFETETARQGQESSQETIPVADLAQALRATFPEFEISDEAVDTAIEQYELDAEAGVSQEEFTWVGLTLAENLEIAEAEAAHAAELARIEAERTEKLKHEFAVLTEGGADSVTAEQSTTAFVAVYDFPVSQELVEKTLQEHELPADENLSEETFINVGLAVGAHVDAEQAAQEASEASETEADQDEQTTGAAGVASTVKPPVTELPSSAFSFDLDIIKAEKLYDSDAFGVDAISGGLSDPFVKVIFADQQHETSVKENSLDPVWDESFSFNVAESTESVVVRLVLLDKDHGDDDALGEAQIDLSTVAAGQEAWLDVILNEKPCGRVQVRFSLGESHEVVVVQKQEAEVEEQEVKPFSNTEDDEFEFDLTIQRCTDLKDADFAGKSDPFIKIAFNDENFQTEVQEGETNPVFNQTFRLRHAALVPMLIQFEVFDQDTGSDDCIGRTQVSLKNIADDNDDVWLDIKHEDKAAGKLLIGVKYVRPVVQEDNKAEEPTPAVDVEPKSDEAKVEEPTEPVKEDDVVAEEANPAQDNAAENTEEEPKQEESAAVENTEEPVQEDEADQSESQPEPEADKSEAEPEPQPEPEPTRTDADEFKFRIEIVRAEDLHDAEFFGSSDPYVTILFGSDVETKQQTKTINGTAHPIWTDETFDFTHKPDTPQIVYLQCMDNDSGKDDELGYGQFALSDIKAQEEGEEFKVTLARKDKPAGHVIIKAIFALGGADLPEKTASNADDKPEQEAKPAEQQQEEEPKKEEEGKPVAEPEQKKEESKPHTQADTFTFQIACLRAADLHDADWGGKSDPYVKIQLGEVTHQTKVIENTVAPEWNESFEIKHEADAPMIVYFQLMDQDTGGDDELGYSQLDLNNVKTEGEEITLQVTRKKEHKGDLIIKVNFQ